MSDELQRSPAKFDEKSILISQVVPGEVDATTYSAAAGSFDRAAWHMFLPGIVRELS